jgi:hypothetical protein
MKNTLAENMLRFGAKNLDAKSMTKLQKLAEQANQEWRASAVLADTANPIGNVIRYPNVFLKDNTTMKPAAILKYSNKSGLFAGMLNNKSAVVFGNLGGQVVGDVESLVTGEIVDPTGWNEYQWVQLLDKYNTTNTLTADGVARFFNSLSKVGASPKFGTLMPDALNALKQIDPNKMTNIYKLGIMKSGVNPNFKQA